MALAVRFELYGGPEVLELVDIPRPQAGAGEVVVEVMSAGLNPVDSGIREGQFKVERPAAFPAGQGSDFAGFVVDVGSTVTGWNVNDAVFGHAFRSAQATFVAVPAGNVIRRPDGLSWEIAGSLHLAASLAWDAVQGANAAPGRTILVHAAAGGVGMIAAQLARLRGARVIGTASPSSFDYLRQRDIIPVEYGPGLEERLADIAPGGIDAELEHFGAGAIDIADSVEPTETAVVERIATLVAQHQIVVPIAAIYPLAQVQDAYRELEAGHAHGKIVLSMVPVEYARQRVLGIYMRETEATMDDPSHQAGPPAHEVLPPVVGHLPHRMEPRKPGESRAPDAELPTGAEPTS
ncbi:NADP-dependent oxidoreductase [Glaciibacter superstes]|uniref:NADP-dependent oxidoreductase n=1 Tax=Glaciibacter superstes TaxID=501023 RepID=UPI0003B4037E|nr:NADP-dependent oxidoreductase [Glaciibacter superstes]